MYTKIMSSVPRVLCSWSPPPLPQHLINHRNASVQAFKFKSFIYTHLEKQAIATLRKVTLTVAR